MLKRIDHIGVIVDRLDEAMTFLTEVFQLAVINTTDNPDRGLKAAFFRCGDVNLEFIELSDPDERARRLGTDSGARIEHIAIEVDNLAGTLELLRKLGIRVDPESPLSVAGGVTTWTEPHTSDGVKYQLIERA